MKGQIGRQHDEHDVLTAYCGGRSIGRVTNKESLKSGKTPTVYQFNVDDIHLDNVDHKI